MNELATTETSNIAIKLNSASQALAEATTDFERIEIRDGAKKLQAISEILNRKDIQVQAANLVVTAEYEIAKANPPETASESGRRGGRGKVKGAPTGRTLSSNIISKIRQAYLGISGSELDQMKQEAVETDEPLTRSKIKKVAKDKKRNQNRVERDIKLESNNTQLPDGTQKYGIIYADPPWRYESATPNRVIENHYPTMDLQEIKDLGVPDICHEVCVLYLWATSAKAPEAFEVMEAWEFTYKSQFVWVKNKIGMGYWARNQHELLLIGTKGKFPPPEPENRISSVINEVRTEHSVKPISVAKMIEANYPNVAKIEMFSRQSRDGWDAFGNESQ